MIIDFSKYSTVKIGGILDVKVIDELCCADEIVIGAASNLLINSPKNIAILDKKFAYIKDCGDYLEVGAATNARELFKFAQKNNLFGFEFLCHLPGLVGGVIKMNAGMKEYEISQTVLEVCVNGQWIMPNFSYRFSNIKGVIFAARFKKITGFSNEIYTQCKNMRKNQPSGASFGSIFKNPTPFFHQNSHGLQKFSSAGQLIDAVGLKGLQKGGAKISEKHANFLINFNHATFFDAKYLIDLAKERVAKEFGCLLQPEVLILE